MGDFYNMFGGVDDLIDMFTFTQDLTDKAKENRENTLHFNSVIECECEIIEEQEDIIKEIE